MTLWNAESLKPIGYIVWPLRSLKVRNKFLTLAWPGDLTFGDLALIFLHKASVCRNRTETEVEIEIHLLTGTEKMAALRAAVFFAVRKKPERRAFFAPPPSSARVKRPPPARRVRRLAPARRGWNRSLNFMVFAKIAWTD